MNSEILTETKMNLLIIYTTKTGTVTTSLDILAKYLPQAKITRCDLNECHEIPTLEDYDFVLIGSSIRMGKVHKKIKSFVKMNHDRLLKLNVGFFLCLGFVDLFDDYMIKNFPKDLRDNAVSITCFGGDMNPDKHTGLDKMIIKMVRADILGGGENGQPRDDISLPTINENNISQLAEIIKSKS